MGHDDGSVLRVKSLFKSFGGIRAVRDIDFAVSRAEVYGIMGPNGAGKTTVLNLLTGIFRADAGAISVNGEDISDAPAHVRARLGLARTYQNVRLFEGLSALDQVICGSYLVRRSNGWQAAIMLPSERRERREAMSRADQLLTRVGVEARRESAATLSYGTQRRVEIARALAARPSVLLLDEPTAGMNPSEAAEIGDLVRRLCDEGLSVVLIEHNMRLIRDYCDRVLVMDFGAKLIEGRPNDCLEDSQVQEAYFGRKSDAERIIALRELRRD